MKRAKYTPVLIITTQRYFRLDYFALVNNFLLFGEEKDCRRSLIIIDEEPSIYEDYTISVKELNLIDSRIKNGITDLDDQEEKDFCITHWNAMKAFYEAVLKEYEQKAIEAKRSVSYEYVSIVNRLHIQKSIVDENSGKTITRRAEPWAAPEIMADFYSIMNKYRYKLIFGQARRIKKEDAPDIWGMLRALNQMNRFGAVHEFRSKESGLYRNQFAIRVSNDLYFDPSLESKILILDGTADISPVYDNAEDERFHVIRGTSDRRMENLTLRIINKATGQTIIRTDAEYREEVLSLVEKTVIHDISEGEEWAIFTNLDTEDYFKERFPGAHIEHFGNIRGKNEFNGMHHIVQVGMNRYPPSNYFLYEIGSDPELHAELLSLSEDGKDTYGIIQDRINNLSGKTKEIMDRLLLCDIEQNMFRGIIRNSEEEPYTYYLFISANEYRRLIDVIYKRYHDQQGANVILPPLAEPSKREKFLRWHNSLNEGQPYGDDEIRGIIDVQKPKKLSDWYKDYPDIQAILANDRVKGRRGVYQKKTQKP